MACFVRVIRNFFKFPAHHYARNATTDSGALPTVTGERKFHTKMYVWISMMEFEKVVLEEKWWYMMDLRDEEDETMGESWREACIKEACISWRDCHSWKNVGIVVLWWSVLTTRRTKSYSIRWGRLHKLN